MLPGWTDTICTILGQTCPWVGPVLYRSCTGTSDNGRLGLDDLSDLSTDRDLSDLQIVIYLIYRQIVIYLIYQHIVIYVIYL